MRKRSITTYAQSLYLALKESANPKLTADNFMAILRRNKQKKLLSQILVKLDEIAAAYNGESEITIETAKPASPQTLEKLKQALEQKYQQKIKLSVNLVPELIGGIRLQFGDLSFKSSVLDQLQTIKETING